MASSRAHALALGADSRRNAIYWAVISQYWMLSCICQTEDVSMQLLLLWDPLQVSDTSDSCLSCRTDNVVLAVLLIQCDDHAHTTACLF